MSLEENAIFKITKVGYQPPDDIVHLVVRNNFIVLALQNSSIIRIDLDNPSEIEGNLN